MGYVVDFGGVLYCYFGYFCLVLVLGVVVLGLGCIWLSIGMYWFFVYCCVVVDVGVVVCFLGLGYFVIVVGNCYVGGVDFDLSVF